MRKSGPKHGFRYGLVAAGLSVTGARIRDFPTTQDKLLGALEALGA